MQEHNRHISNLGEFTMYQSVKTETLVRWLELAERLDQQQIAREIEAEIKARSVNEKPASD